MDRSEINRALSKAIAYKNCGKDKEAQEWAKKLIYLLECAEILKEEDPRGPRWCDCFDPEEEQSLTGKEKN